MDLNEIIEIQIDDRLNAKTVEELECDCNFSILLVIRDDISILPKDKLVLRLNDIVVVRLS
jgi:Trk K+ transport system NAD-binding subunit